MTPHQQRIAGLESAAKRLLNGISNARSNLTSECADLRDAIESVEKSPVGGVPNKALCLFKDGNQWCATYADFTNLQESPAGFGGTWEEAATGLQLAADAELDQREQAQKLPASPPDSAAPKMTRGQMVAKEIYPDGTYKVWLEHAEADLAKAIDAERELIIDWLDELRLDVVSIRNASNPLALRHRAVKWLREGRDYREGM